MNMTSIQMATGELEQVFYSINCEVVKDYNYGKDLSLSDLSDYWGRLLAPECAE